MQQTQYAYTLTLPTHLVDEWSWFEARGYLPSIPGEVIGEDLDDTVTLGIQEHEAWEFQDEADALGESFLACVAFTNEIISFLNKIV